MNNLDLFQTQADALEIRKLVITMLEKAGSGHAGGALGLADIYAVLYREVLHHNPLEPNWADRDRVVVSNGHTCPVLYASLALHGYFPVEKLDTLRQIGSDLQGHPHENVKLGIETSSGPLGQGLSQSIGMGLAARLSKSDHHIFCFTSDGEHQEGQTWEAYEAGAKYALDNLTVIVDRNYIQISGVTESIMPLDSLPDKIKAFGWQVYEIDGNNLEEIRKALFEARDDKKPSVIVAYTEPGKGVDFIEDRYTWHGEAPDAEQAANALRQLNSLNGLLETEHD